MATYTPNYNLSKPEASDPFENFRQSYNDNMDEIDRNLGGGGGSGGHTIYDKDGNALAQESGLQFTGSVSVTDDAVNGRTVVDISGGGGNVYGAFIDPSRVIVSSAYTSNLTYTATEDCFFFVGIASSSNSSSKVYIDGQQVYGNWNGSGGVLTETPIFPMKSGQTITVNATYGSSSAYVVYGVTQGTNGIFAPVIYSDTERKIGVWRDNKPLYQKTFSGLSISCPNQGVWYSTGQNYGDIENIVFCEIVDQYGQRISGSAGYMNLTPKPIALNLALDNRVVKAFTIQYTKTTDVAGSGNWNTDGVPTHHYSTSEQVVGTYFGKPLYEKTINCGALPNSTTKNVAHSISDIDYAVIIRGSARNPNNGIQIPLPYVYGNTRCLQTYIDSTNIKLISSENMSGYTESYVTIQYTKTTD